MFASFTRYSIVMRTGPCSGLGSTAITGSAQCIEGARSVVSTLLRLNRFGAKTPAAAPTEANDNAKRTPECEATNPHTALPPANDPMNTRMYNAIERARTHSGE